MSGATFQVFVERPRDPGPGAVARLAAAIAQRYGLPASDLEARLAVGRLRVKAGVDRATADRFAADLEQLGAVCAIVDGTGATVNPTATLAPTPARAAAPAAPAPAAQAPAPAAPAPIRSVAATPAVRSSALAPSAAPSSPPARPSAASFQSGLAAAFGGPSAAPDLGALDADASAYLLSALDGSGDDGGDAPAASSFGPPGALPASMGPAIPPLPASMGPAISTTPAAPSAAPPGRFAPPGSFGPPVEDAAVELDVMPRRRPGPTSGDPDDAGLTLAAEPPAVRGAGRDRPATLHPAPGTVADVRGATAPQGQLRAALGDARIRLAVGVGLAVVLGFVPAHFVAAMREDGAFAELDHQYLKEASSTAIEGAVSAAAVRDCWQARKQSRQRDIALGSLVVWAAAGCGVGYLWFRKIDWDRLAR